MKLIIETVEEVKYLVEENNGQKSHFIEGVFMQSEQKNRNGRVYPKPIMEREVKRYEKEYINEKRAFGELGHPDSPSINLDRVSHMIVSLKEDGNNYIGKAKILGTPYGNIVKNLIDEGAKLGVSSRGMGSLKPSNGYQLVQDDFYLATAADIVADPSAPDAFVRGIMENKEWVFMNGVLQEMEIEQMQKQIKRAKQKQLEEVKLRQFANFISKL
jgi:hypothetical protein